MHFERMFLNDVVKVVPARFGDSRGYFSEVFKDQCFRNDVADVTFVQENESLSATSGTVRGLHFQLEPFAQGKLVRCTRGAIFDVAVDIRRGSSTFCKWVGAELSPTTGDQLWIPPGFAHGFVTLEPFTVVQYKVTAYYSAKHDRGIFWRDPEIGIDWPIDASRAFLSAKDRDQPRLAEILKSVSSRSV